ncbi:hypothetical protein [Streptomyces sp. NBC_01013]|uniref:hypothetical protein n=1 Tax=Streptomyces sp. NBC_01013 TaxID=2903718 RepID=UPI00386D4F01|nr:hypothetical protein OG538_25515 [Streptomyces sp. NBC_01013]
MTVQLKADTALVALAGRSFSLIPRDASRAEAAERLGSCRFGVVLNSTQRPLALITADDLDPVSASRVPLRPVVTCAPELALGELADSDGITLLDLTHGFVLVAQDAVVGVVPAATIEAYLPHHRAHDVRSSDWKVSASDSGLPGTSTAEALVVCQNCSYVNSVAFYDPRRPPICGGSQSPEHALEIALDS